MSYFSDTQIWSFFFGKTKDQSKTHWVVIQSGVKHLKPNLYWALNFDDNEFIIHLKVVLHKNAKNTENIGLQVKYRDLFMLRFITDNFEIHTQVEVDYIEDTFYHFRSILLIKNWKIPKIDYGLRSFNLDFAVTQHACIFNDFYAEQIPFFHELILYRLLVL